MRVLLTPVLLLALVLSAHAIEVDDLDELEGFTLVVKSTVVGDFEGADFDKLVKLDNGMVFEFQSYNYEYAYRPSAAVFARALKYQGKAVSLYKLVIEDTIYDVMRIR
jgi:hypothetical protein